MMALNEEENQALIEFRERVEHITENKEDEFLLRWLRARNLDLDKSEQMLKNCIEWREREDIKSLLHWEGPELIVKSFQWRFTGYDSEGRPILVVPYGKWEVRKFIELGKKEEAMKVCRKLLEEIAFEIEKKKGEKVTQFVAIMDSAELTFWKIASIETVNSTVQFFREFESYYPETLHSCYIVNAPWVFPIIFNAVKPLLSMRTLGKVKIFDSGNKWKNVLKENLPKDALPIEYHGTGKSIHA